MISTQDILYGVTGQSLVLDCEDGRPSSVTSVAVYETSGDDTSTAETATTGAAAIETTPNTTVDVASGVSESNPRKLYVASTSGATVGRRLLLTSTYGHSELVEVAGIASGDYLTLKHPLVNDYDVTTSTLKSTRCSISIDSSWVAALENLSQNYNPNPRYRVRWVVVLAGEPRVYDRYFDLLRYPAQHGVTPLDVEERQPGWIDALGPDDRADQGRGIIRRAFNDVKYELYGDNKAEQASRNAEALAELVIARTVVMTLDQRVIAGANVSPAAMERAVANWRQRYDQFVRSPVIAVDTAGGGASAPIRPQPLWSR